MVGFENRSGMYFWVHEHRKRKTAPFAGRQNRNIPAPLDAHRHEDVEHIFIARVAHQRRRTGIGQHEDGIGA